MPNSRLSALSDDACYARWQAAIERIKTETIYLFTTRHHFNEVVGMFRENPNLNAIGANVYQWLLGMWGRDALIAVRREIDGQSNTINLIHLFEEMERRPTVMTRGRYLGHLTAADSVFVRKMMNEGFNSWGATSHESGDSDRDYIPAHVIAADRTALQQATATAFSYAQRMVAHRTPIEGLEISVADINAAIDAIEPVVKKYYLMFTGASLVDVVATAQYDWAAPFDIPWRVGKSGI